MITSHRNPLIKRIRRLGQKKYRRQEGAFFVEGIRAVLMALERQAPVETVVYAPELLTSEIAWEAIAKWQAAGSETTMISGDLFRTLSERDNPVGLGAVVGTQLHALETLSAGEGEIFVALDDISDPGNLGTIVRTLDGMGGAGLILVGQTTDPFHPTAVKASMGALFNIPVAEVDRMETLWAWAEENGVSTVATSAHADALFWTADYRFPVLLLLGSEGEGLPPEVIERADLAVSIPMHGASSSLNLAVAGGLLLYELRRAAGGRAAAER
ncbi:MAG: RNA methyltransferase [Candidatus Promineifilaceae bacterium]|nr:RNA methyltransferase [Candidatus Promineifilaceae bacterium]